MGPGSRRWLWALAVTAVVLPAAAHPAEAPHHGLGHAVVVDDTPEDQGEFDHVEEHGGHDPHAAHAAHSGGQRDAHASHDAHSGAHESGHGHHGHGGGHHHIVKSVMGTTTAVMLLGFVAFIMALFYLVNWHDPDIRLYTWVISSVTVSIFLGVLCFEGVTEAIDFFMPDTIATEFLQFLMLWTATQTILFVVRGSDDTSSPSKCEGKDGAASYTEMQCLEGQTSAREESNGCHNDLGSDDEGGRTPNVPLKAYGMILAHITGFAGIRCFGSMQLHIRFFAQTWKTTLLVIPIFCVVVYLLIMISQFTRKTLIVNTGDQKEDESEMLWREQCIETEDDTVGLVLSSLVSVVIRYTITGHLPSAHGTTEGRQAMEVFKLTLTGLGCLAAIMLMTYQRRRMIKRHEEDNSIHITQFFSLEHFVNTMQIFFGLTMSWCFYFATQWGFYVFLKDQPSMKGVTGKLLEALLVSFGSILTIFVLDAVGDGSPSMKKALKGLITALGLLVGISWEGAFALGVNEIAANWETPHAVLAVKSSLALGLVAIVLPAWRLYIMPKSDPAIMRYYRGKLPPLVALCTKWDPAKDEHLSKTERYERHQKAANALNAVKAVTRATLMRKQHPRAAVE